MTRFRNELTVWAVLATALPLLGCNDSRFDIAPVSGRITIDGLPISEAQVVFAPVSSGSDHEAGYYSMGKTDLDGMYSLQTLEKKPRDGAVVAEHRVFISKVVPGAKAGGDKQEVPPPYNDERTTPFTFDVGAGGSTKADFELTTSSR